MQRNLLWPPVRFTADASRRECGCFNRPGRLHFFDPPARIVKGGGSDLSVGLPRFALTTRADADYIQLPDGPWQYEALKRPALLAAGAAELKDFRNRERHLFEGWLCLPIESLARRGDDTCATGRSKRSARSGSAAWGDLFGSRGAPDRRPRGVQLRQEDRGRPALGIWCGFQTNLKWAEQKRVFRLIPGLARTPTFGA